MAKEKLELKGLSEQDLKEKISAEELRLKKMTFGHAITPIENPMSIRAVRRDIARMNTELRKRQLGF
ncbi:LSU ribosomal protein L29P [Chitinophaga ginsengisegetis]|jgi:large subunit ribosomal protein L29|uniref:Large ribosomal subunit protein uL29 n=2 Tax=Chitinophaga TaxID=79328 RepID=A0A1T5P1P5_9BACT|nr:MULTISPECIES: 50S ribosomal protein L29 [Chitinophaga]MBS0026569.1 50S ribosomal protein L29 [Chitinophaga hostae]MDR6566768.1 large subunit ribosomal protein L29 [Chitinophaga ginsengisegetis]MDR6646498.1 large subunit ribosomal protein L29 [Chitinophaga ginsengisegetis]MDR6652848.1 large subunit ribosomal protein L29 [Chitinophaga ginsengisegetis]SKD06632.1 LSU ribosomal protein L29P [Chitinophaga ginsengisegetis]